MKARKTQGTTFAPIYKKMRASGHAANADRFDGWPEQGDAFTGHMPDAQDLFSNVEDLWLRLARTPAIRCAVKTNATTGVRLVMFRQLQTQVTHEVEDLLDRAASHRTYVWQGGHDTHCLVRRVEWCGDVLVIEVASSRQLGRSMDGEALDWQLCALCMKLQQARRA